MSNQHDEIATTDAGTVEGPSLYQRFAAYVAERAPLDGGDVAAELNSQQMNAILSATTEEELEDAMNMAGLIALKDLDDGTEIQINGYHFVPSYNPAYASRLGVWVVIDAQRVSDGTPLALDTGVERVIAWLRMVESGAAGIAFPQVRRVKIISTQSGNSMVTLERIPDRAVSGRADNE